MDQAISSEFICPRTVHRPGNPSLICKHHCINKRNGKVPRQTWTSSLLFCFFFFAFSHSDFRVQARCRKDITQENANAGCSLAHLVERACWVILQRFLQLGLCSNHQEGRGFRVHIFLDALDDRTCLGLVCNLICNSHGKLKRGFDTILIRDSINDMTGKGFLGSEAFGLQDDRAVSVVRKLVTQERGHAGG